MRITQLFTKTLREAPAEAETISHQLLLRAGMIHQIGTGIYSYLPLGWRALRKIEQIIREELDKVGYRGYVTFEYFHPYLHYPEALIYHTSDSLDRILGRIS